MIYIHTIRCQKRIGSLLSVGSSQGFFSSLSQEDNETLLGCKNKIEFCVQILMCSTLFGSETGKYILNPEV